MITSLRVIQIVLLKLTMNVVSLCTLCCLWIISQTLGQIASANKQLKISMPLVETSSPDQYICYAYPLTTEEDIYVLSSLTEADKSLAHHVTTGVCEEPTFTGTTWDCTKSQGHTCKGDAVNFGLWDEFSNAKDNGAFKLPEGVSLMLGPRTNLKYFLIQVHFMNPVENPRMSAANVTLEFTTNPTALNYQTYAFASSGSIPAKSDNGFFAENACEWKRPAVLAHRYYLHTHHYGVLVEGFLVRNNSWTLLGSQLAKDKKKGYYVIPGGPVEIRPGDVVAARCLYINRGTEPIGFGMSGGEEMCNFQLDIGFRPEDADHFRRPAMCTAESPTFRFCDHEETAAIC